MTRARIVLLITALLYALFAFWYGGSGDPLTLAETESHLAEIRARSGDSSTHDGDLIESFRVLASQDDGREFYMLNLMRLREKALYPEGSSYGDDPVAAADRYNAAVVPALLKRGSLPILLGRYAGAFIPPDQAADRWDQIGIIRYRSRRDMLEMAKELAASGGGVHKWASLEETIVFPLSPIFDFVFVRGIVFVLLFGLGGGLAFALRRRSA